VQIQECEHYFCGWCLKEWLRHNPTCPVCRRAPKSIGRSRLLDNLVEIFLHDHQNLTPSVQRRAEHVSYTPGEDLLGPLSRESNSSATQLGVPSPPSPTSPSTETPHLPDDSLSALRDFFDRSRVQNPQVRAGQPTISLSESSRSPMSSQSPFLGFNNVEEIDRNTYDRENPRAVTPGFSRPANPEQRSVTPVSTLSPFFPTPTSSRQPTFIGNLSVHNHCRSQ
jgi:hypothetical protein